MNPNEKYLEKMRKITKPKLTLVKSWLPDYQVKYIKHLVSKGQGVVSKSSVIRDALDKDIQANSK